MSDAKDCGPIQTVEDLRRHLRIIKGSHLAAAADEQLEQLIPWIAGTELERKIRRDKAVEWFGTNAPDHVKLWFTALQVGILSKDHQIAVLEAALADKIPTMPQMPEREG